MKKLKPTKAIIEEIKKRFPKAELAIMTVPANEDGTEEMDLVILVDIPKGVTGNCIRHLGEEKTEAARKTILRNVVKFPEFNVLEENEYAYLVAAKNLIERLPIGEYFPCERPEVLPEGISAEELEKQESFWKIHWFHVPDNDFYFAARFPGRAALAEYEREKNVSIAFEKLIRKSLLTPIGEVLEDTKLFFTVGTACNSLMPNGAATIKKL